MMLLAAFAGAFLGGLVGYAWEHWLRGRGPRTVPPSPVPMPPPSLLGFPVIEDQRVPPETIYLVGGATAREIVSELEPDRPPMTLDQIERERQARDRLAREATRERPVGT